ncbi:phosphopentomutase [uncultured Cohaesibacter sp.]|uniref:phosphopentomutase n=1 Tax=uncultured Cohaesibacter sp. TaxID=1002546 RepID=UPI002AAB5643|nr:phosphopentomutase [uncultured Cohaesibacter sp.]
MTNTASLLERRVFLCVLDSVGCGGAPDAAAFGDEGANTLLHIAEACSRGECEDGRHGLLHLPNLAHMGLGSCINLASGSRAPGIADAPQEANWAVLQEVSKGKDTQTGHWELAGLPLAKDWTYFPDTDPAFPEDLMQEFMARAGLEGTLANIHGSGTEMIDRFAEEHLKTGYPITYTSADSVFQIAAHEESFGLERLYEICKIAADIFHPLGVGRVIARPFVGTVETGFERTKNRKDLAIKPAEPTICDRVIAKGGDVRSLGKIADIFAMRGISVVGPKADDMGLVDQLLDACDTAKSGDLVFANFVEFDSHYGHRRDICGYAKALERFDRRVPEILARLKAGDLLLFTADHGNDPTWHGNDHTRERVPLLIHEVPHGSQSLSIKPEGTQVIKPFGFVADLVAGHLGC